MKSDAYGTKETLLAISSVKTFAKQLIGKGKEYNDFLQYWLKRYDYYDEDSRLPAVKDVLEETGIPYSKLRKHISDIYGDLRYGIDEGIDFRYTEKEYEFILKGAERNAYVTISDIPVMPRVGEMVRIPFLKEHLYFDQFYVDKIIHEFEDNKQSVKIYLRHGDYNLFWHHRRDQAELEEDLHFMDLIEEPDFQLQRKLGYHKRWREMYYK